MLHEDDIRRLYAKLNAHEVMLQAVLFALAGNTQDEAHALDDLRQVAMELGDTLHKRTGDPNSEFAEQGRIETLEFIAQTFDRVRGIKGA
jgi:hypothetical protein